MRIIGGEYRSRAILAPKGQETRPTLDQIREALFNILQFSVEGRDVLDLYAGSGALGLEALSRGAKSAVLADISREAQAAIEKNIQSLRCQDRATLLKAADMAALRKLSMQKTRFDLIFLDPPYKMDAAAAVDEILALGLLKNGGLIIIEHAEEHLPACPPALTLVKHRDYRGTGITILGRKEDGTNEVPVSRQF